MIWERLTRNNYITSDCCLVYTSISGPGLPDTNTWWWSECVSMSSAFPVLYHDHRAGVSGRSGAESDTDTCMRTLGTVQTSTTTTCKQSEPGAASRSSSIDSILWWELCSFCSIFIIWVARLQVFTFWDLHSSHHISDGFYLLCKFAFLFNEIIDSETEKIEEQKSSHPFPASEPVCSSEEGGRWSDCCARALS